MSPSSKRALAPLLMIAALSCGEPTAKAPAGRHDGGRPKRVFESPPGEVRPVPPFAIRSDGVGPYLIGADLKEVLDTVPRGPRIELLTIDGVAEYDLVRAEDAGLLVGADRAIGAQRSKVSFVAALEPKLAKTSSGIGVGSSTEELAEALGAPLSAPARATDPRVHEFASLPGVRFVVVGDRVIAVIVAPRPGDREPEPPSAGECRTGGALAEAVDAVRKASKLEGKALPVVFGCFSGETPEALVVGTERIAIVAGDAERPRRLATARTPQLRYAAPIDVDGDGRDEIAMVYFLKRKGARIARVELARIEGGKLVESQGHDAYEVSSSGSAWTGAHVEEVDLLVEVSSDGQRLTLGGIYVHRVKGRVREIAPLVSRSRRLKKERPR